MAKLIISDAARGCRVARSTLQRAINAGRLSLDHDHRIDTAELLRAGFTLHAARQPHAAPTLHGTLQDAAGRSSSTRQDAAALPGADVALMQHTIAALERENTLLHAALDAAAAREEEARAQAQAAREERTLLLQMLQDMQQRYDRLLDMPRNTPPEPPQQPPGATQASRRPTRYPELQGTPQGQPAASSGDPRGEMCRRILALLREHPDGLTTTELRTMLGVERSLADTCLGMLKYGLIKRIGRGTYVATDPHTLDNRSHHADTDR